MIKGLKITDLDTLRKTLPTILKTVGNNFGRKYTADIIRIANKSAEMTEEIV